MPTPSAKDYLKAEADKKIEQATAITDAASDEGRALTLEERKSVETLLDEVGQLKARVKDIEDNEAITETIERIKGEGATPPQEAPPGAKTVGEAFVKSDGYQAIKSGKLSGEWSSGTIEVPDSFVKANVTETLSPVIQPAVQPGIYQASAVALRDLTVADILMQGTTDSNTVRYLLETTNVNAAASVLEGDSKPESTITFTQVDESVRKVATFLPVSDEMLEDVSQIRSYLDNRLALFVRHAEENQLLLGSGTAPQLRGIVNRTGVQTATRSSLGTTTGEAGGASTLGNAFFQAITNIRLNALTEPDAIVVHPTNWAAMRLAKDSALQYLGGGPMIGAYGNNIQASNVYWGLQVVVTSRMTLNTALVGAFGTMAQVFYRGGVTIEATNSHGTFFKENLTAIRAERRLALAVYRPEAFHLITALQTP